MEMQTGSHSVYRLEYHLIFVVKYRKKCITEEIGKSMVDDAARLLEKWEGKLIEGNTDVDHIHLLVSLSPKYAIAPLVGSLKNTLARNTRKRYGDYLEQFLWGKHFWSESYYIASVGDTSEERVKKYIEEQGRKKRKYVKRKEKNVQQ